MGYDPQIITTTASFDFDKLYIIVAALGIPGNLFTILVLLSSPSIRQKPVNIFIVHQSIIDTLVCIVTICNTIFNDADMVSSEFGKQIFCSILVTRNPMWVAIQTSGYNLMFLTLERYWAIIKPFSYNQSKVMGRLPYVFILCWLIAMASITPNIIFNRVVNGRCIPFYTVTQQWLLKFIGFYILTIYCFIPGGVMVISYISIGLSLRKSQVFQNSDSSTQSDKLHKAQMNLLQTCVILMVMFVLCWTNHVIRIILISGGYFMHLRTSYYPSTALLIVINSCLNPFVYCVRYKEFQGQVKRLIGGKSRRSLHSTLVTETSKF